VLTAILWFILVGAVVGVIARLIVPGPNPIGVLLTILVGIAGAVVGGSLADATGAGDVIAFIVAVAVSAIGVALMTGYLAGARSWRLRRWHTRRRHTSHGM
jgi:uncharacterized membrane protein YeaQ/YmgE (transglycosylase-associated protein family)